MRGNKKKLLLLDLDETLVHSEIRDKNNLANSLEKQALYIKRFNPKFIKYFNKSSIKYYNNDDLKKLNDELNVLSYSIVKKFESDRIRY